MRRTAAEAGTKAGTEARAGGGAAGGTALARYLRLESTGLWRPSPGDQAREIAVRLGQATLVLIDPRSGVALGHWSLPAIRRLPGRDGGAAYAPGRDTEETLVLTDPDLIAALDALEAAGRAATPRPGRLRGIVVGAALAALVAGAALALPPVLASWAAANVPASRRAEIGQQVLDDIEAVIGPSCAERQGLAALARLSERLFGPVDTPIIHVLDEGLARPLHLPGGLILLPRSLLDEPSPQALAGAALVEDLVARSDDPMRALLADAGLRATAMLMMTGELAPSALDGYGRALLRRESPPLPSSEALAAAFAQAGLAPAPYAQWRARTVRDSAADILPPGTGPEPAALSAPAPLPMPDNDWVALQSLCAR